MLARIVDIRRWLREDRRTPYADRVARDRAIGRTLKPGRDLVRVLAWWSALDDAAPGPARPQGRTLGHRVETGRRVAGVGLGVLGLLVGAAVAGVAFGYEGRYPVNLFTLLGVLVGLPTLMLLFTLLVLPGRLPGLKSLQTVAAGVSPGRWVGAWLDRLLGAELFAPGLLGGAANAFSRWQLVVFSQWLALGFFAGALAIALLLVTFTDLAFGWSTTLNVDAGLVQTLVSTLSAPWAAWLPSAAPDSELVAASRFFRLDEAAIPQERVARLGEWWPFVLMTVLVYGALPRLLLLLVGLWRLRRATRALLLDDPEVTALLDRLEAPLVALGGGADDRAPAADQSGLPGPAEALEAEGLVLLIWNRAATPDVARAWLAANLGVEPEASAELGILQRDAERRDVLAALRQSVTGRVRRVVLVTKGWEPPLLEFMDFLGQVREALGGQTTVTVVPLDVAGEAVKAAERDVWARALARVRDPRLYVIDATGETPS